MSRLPRTTTFKLGMLYLGLFVVSVGLILAVVYRTTAGFLEQEVADEIADELAELASLYRQGGAEELAHVARARSAAPHTNSIYLLSAPDGTVLTGNLTGWPASAPPGDGWFHVQVAEYGGAEDRPATAQAAALTFADGTRLLVGRDMSELDELRRRMVGSLGWVLFLTAGLGVIGGTMLGQSALRRIEAINRTTRRIMAGDLSRRVPDVGSDDEIDRLAGNLNAMLDRIEGLMAGMRQVSESVAHDLRTPLTRLRSRLELALLDERADAEAYRAALAEAIGEADRLLATFAALLSIAEAESGARRTDFVPVDLGEVARSMADLYEPVAEEAGLAFILHVAAAPPVRGNAQLLAQAVANLLDNAVKYTPPGGRITLAVEGPTVDQIARLTVADTGPGVPAAMRGRVLERFVRLDAARATPGNGLGLSLVNAVARLHGARLELADNPSERGPGLRVGLVLPPEAAA